MNQVESLLTVVNNLAQYCNYCIDEKKRFGFKIYNILNTLEQQPKYFLQ